MNGNKVLGDDKQVPQKINMILYFHKLNRLVCPLFLLLPHGLGGMKMKAGYSEICIDDEIW